MVNSKKEPLSKVSGSFSTAGRQGAMDSRDVQREMDVLLNIMRTLDSSPSDKALLRYCPQLYEALIGFSFSDSSRGDFSNGEQKLLGVSGDPDKDSLLFPVFMAHEQRHAWQNVKGILIDNQLGIFDRLALQRAYEADCLTLEITVAAELRQMQGEDNSFMALMNIEGSAVPVKAFEKELQADPESLFDGRAQRAAYLAYLSKENLVYMTSYDQRACNQHIKFNAKRASKNVATSGALNMAINKLFYMPYEDRDTGKLAQRPAYNDLKNTITPQILLEHMDKKIVRRARSIANKPAELKSEFVL